MRLVFVHGSASVYGSDRSLVELVRGATAGNHQVLVLLPEDGPLVQLLHEAGAEVEIRHLAIVRIGASPKYYFRLLGALVGAFRLGRRMRGTVDLVHSNTSQALSGAVLARAGRIPHIWHVRELPRHGLLQRVLIGLITALMADLRICISGSVADAFYGWIPARARPWVEVVPNGVSEEILRRGAAFERDVAGPLRVAYVGRLTAWKGVALLVDATSPLRRSGAVTLRIAGEAKTLADEDFVGDLVRTMALRDDEVAIEFLGEVADPVQVYGWCEVLVAPNLEPEPFGRTIIEAMACGCAVVASNLGGIGELIREGETGVLVTPRDRVALEAALARLAGERARAASIGATARTEVGARFASTTTYSEVSRLYMTLLDHQ